MSASPSAVQSVGIPSFSKSQYGSGPLTPVTTSRSELKSYVMEKEMFDSQVREVSLENSALQLENRLIKDKYGRAIAHISELETILQQTRSELHIQQTKLEDDSSQERHVIRAEMEREIELHKSRASSCARETEVLKSENSFLEEKLNALHKEAEILKHSMDKSKIFYIHKQETEILKDEINCLKNLLQESEHALETEIGRSRNLTECIEKMKEMQEVFQMQITETSSGSSAAERQVASLQIRLRVTEERLAQERADRAGNLMQIEEKLLLENAKLQTMAKELERCHKRERDKARNLEHVNHQLREENLQLRLSVPEKEDKTYDIPYNRASSKQCNSKKLTYDPAEIWKQLESEGGLTHKLGDTDSLVVHLWAKCNDLQQKIKEWRLHLEQLELPVGEDGADNLQGALAVKNEYEAKMQQIEEKFEDVSAEKITAEQTYKQQLTDLVKEKHEAFSRLKTLEDLMDALRAENESLRQSLTMTSGSFVVKPGDRDASESQVEVLHAEIASLQANISQITRRNKVLESEISTLQCQLASRDKELTETFTELKIAQMTPKLQKEDEQITHQRMQSLTSEVATLKEEMYQKSGHCSAVELENNRLKAELNATKDELCSTKKRNREKDLNSVLTQKNQIQKLETELEKKDEEILKLTMKVNESEALVFNAQLELSHHQKTHQDLEAQLVSVQQDLDQRCKMLDALCAKENNQLQQLEMVKEMIQTLTKGLAQKDGELEILKLQLQEANERAVRLENQNVKLASTTEATVNKREAVTKSFSSSSDLRLSEMRFEKDKLEAQLLQKASALNSLQEDCEVLNGEVNKAKQEASVALIKSTQLANENAVLERRTKNLEEERTLIREERDMCKGDIDQLETSLHEVVSKFKNGSTCNTNRLYGEHDNNSLVEDTERKLNDELHSLHLIVFAKEKEMSVVMDRVKRQELELRNADRKCEISHREIEQCRNDVSRVTNELVQQMKENKALTELNRILLREQTSLQKKLAQLEHELAQEKKRAESRKSEIQEVIKKFESSEEAHVVAYLTLQQKDSVISEQEVKQRQLSQDLNQSHLVQDGLVVKVDELTQSVRSLSNVNTDLELKIEALNITIQDQQSVINKQREEVLTMSHKLENLKHEESLMLNNLCTEKKAQDKLQEQVKAHEVSEHQLNDKIAELNKELETQKGFLVAAKETIQQTKSEKEIFMKDYHDACRCLGEKETAMQEVQKKKDEEIIHIKYETLKHMEAYSIEKQTSERELGQLRQEIVDLKNQLHEKEEQLCKFSQTITDLENAKRKIVDLEGFTTEQDKTAAESKILVESLRSEIFSLRDRNTELQDTIARKEVAILDLRDQLRNTEKSSESQVAEMKHTVEGMRSHHEYEKKSLREAHNKMEENLKLSVQELKTLKDAHYHISEQVHIKEKALGETNQKLSQEVAAQKFTEEKLIQLQETMADLKQKKADLEKNLSSMQISLNKAETGYSVGQEKIKYLTSQLKNMQVALAASEGAVKTRDQIIESLKADLIRHQQVVEDQRHQSTDKLQKLNQDLKQQKESQEKEQFKLNQKAHQLSVDLELARETLLIKNKDNLKLQERVLELKTHLREGETRLKHTENSLRHEEELQTRLSSRFEEQESELKKLRHFLANKAEEDGDGKGMWQEMNHVISELSHQLQFHIETTHLLDKGDKDDRELILNLRRSLLEAESQLNTERALHAVTRSSMQALEEDCTRLRQTIAVIRRRGALTEKKQKSRMEEINEIIARSQTRAQALLASGEITFDGSLHNLSPSRDYSLTETNFSPDTSYGSDANFSGTHLANLSFLNLSGTLGACSAKK